MLSFFQGGLIWGLSSLTPDSIPIPGIDFPFAQTAHFFLYFILAFFLYNAFFQTNKKQSFLKRSVQVFFICFLYGVLDEFHQSFVPGRHPSGYDVLLDGAGALSYLVLTRTREKLRAGRGTAFSAGLIRKDKKEF